MKMKSNMGVSLAPVRGLVTPLLTPPTKSTVFIWQSVVTVIKNTGYQTIGCPITTHFRLLTDCWKCLHTYVFFLKLHLIRSQVQINGSAEISTLIQLHLTVLLVLQCHARLILSIFAWANMNV